MSIPNLIHKIKSKTGIDKVTIMYLFIIVGVGIGSFGLGRISIDDKIETKSNVPSNQEFIVFENHIIEGDNDASKTQIQSIEKKYVASKNGKMYYSVGCSGAKRIKTENQIWFATKEDAEKSGYTLSSTCK